MVENTKTDFVDAKQTKVCSKFTEIRCVSKTSFNTLHNI